MAKTFTIQIDDAQEKALEWDIVNLDTLPNAIYTKADWCIERICEMAIKDKTNTILSAPDRQQLRNYLDNQGIVLTSIKDIPLNIKKEIVKRANIKSATERQAELEAEMEKEKTNVQPQSI